MSNICEYEGMNILLVEGKNDCHVVLALLQYYNVNETFGIYSCNNDDGILKRLNALISKPDPPETIGVIIDADNPDLMGRWQQVKNKISNYNYDIPESPKLDGTIIEKEGSPRLGFWLMPNNNDPGMLEDFLIEMADKDALSSAEDCIEVSKKNGVTTFKNVHYSKALIHTYLAWQDEPGMPLGLAITAHALKPETKIAKRFVAWLNLLFN